MNDDRLGQRVAAVGAQLDRDRVQEDDLDVEQDEQHRDQVEADPEAHLPLDLRGQAALVGVLLVRRRAARADEGVQRRERAAHGAAENEEDDRREIAAQHRALLYHRLWQSVT